MRGASILSTFGWVLGMLSIAEVLTALVATGYGERDAVMAFSAACLMTGFVSIGLIFGFRDRVVALRRRHGLALVALVWLGVPAFACLPFAALTAIDDPLVAWFEAVSAFTTTGASLVATPASPAGRSLVFWTAALQWSGGAATVTFAAAALDRSLPRAGEGLLVLTSALADQSRLAAAARDVLAAYTLLTALCFFSLLASGVPRFDAICLALAALATGAVYPSPGGMAGYDSLLAGWVMTAFMLAGGLGTLLARDILTGRALQPGVRPVLGIALAAVFAIGVGLALFAHSGGPADIPERLTAGVYSAAALATTSGMAWAADTVIAVPFPLVFVLVMVGGAYGSTAGGLKVGRVLRMLRDARTEMERLIHPSAVSAMVRTSGGVEPGRVVWTYFAAYMLFFAVMAGITALHNVDFEHSLLWAAATLANAGPALGYTAPATVDPLSLIAEGSELLLLASVVTMVLGRIEVLALLAVVTPLFWKR